MGDCRIFGVNAEYEHRSSHECNNLNGQTLSAYHISYPPSRFRFRDTCLLHVFKKDEGFLRRSFAAKSANLIRPAHSDNESRIGFGNCCSAGRVH